MNDSKQSLQDLSIRGEPVQRIFLFYVQQRFIVNRRYQRKLVWSIEEKRSFIDSLVKGYPVPLILLAEDDDKRFEIIDGMQRLNAITSFIEGEYDLGDKYFDLNTTVESKSLLDEDLLQQKTPVLERHICQRIASYTLALSIYSAEQQTDVDEVFRRINSNGRILSPQELRAAGATGDFADLVRSVASHIRGDVSYSDVLPLNKMKYISISNKELPYGIPIENVFWVKQGILTKDGVRQSQDEQLVSDLLSSMCFDDLQPSRREIFDEYFGISDTKSTTRFTQIENWVRTTTPREIVRQFMSVHQNIRSAVEASGQSFSQLIFGEDPQRAIPRYYQVIFISIYELLYREGLALVSQDRLIRKLRSSGAEMDIGGGSGTWSAEEKRGNVETIKRHLRAAFRKAGTADPAVNNWATEIENILRQSFTEQNLFDFKQGLMSLQSEKIDEQAFNKIIKTLTAMANYGRNAKGYVLIGIADDEHDAKKISSKYHIKTMPFDHFLIVGVNHEAKSLGVTLEQYFQTLVNRIKTQPIPPWFRDSLLRSVKSVRYADKQLFVLEAAGGTQPVSYDDQFYVRRGANTEAIKASEYQGLFERFILGSDQGAAPSSTQTAVAGAPGFDKSHNATPKKRTVPDKRAKR